MDWINITLVCENGHEAEAGAGGAELEVSGEPTFMATSSWDFCDDCGTDEIGSSIRSDWSRLKGFEEVRKILLQRKKHQLTIIPDEPNWFEMNVEGMQI